MNTNKFNIGDRVWLVDYTPTGFFVRKCLVIGMKAFLTDVSQIGVVEKCIQAIQYSLYPISKCTENGMEFLCDEDSRIDASPRRVFEDKEEAFHFMDTEIMNIRKELEDEY